MFVQPSRGVALRALGLPGFGANSRVTGVVYGEMRRPGGLRWFLALEFGDAFHRRLMPWRSKPWKTLAAGPMK